MAVYKSNKPTKDGRIWFFRIKYKDMFGNIKDYTSSKFKFKKEAVEHESQYRLNLKNFKGTTISKTFDELFEEYMYYKKQEVKKQTIPKIENIYTHIHTNLGNVKVDELSVENFNKFKSELDKLKRNGKPFSISYKNKILTLLKALINHSSKFYNINSTIPELCGNYKSVNEQKKK